MGKVQFVVKNIPVAKNLTSGENITLDKKETLGKHKTLAKNETIARDMALITSTPHSGNDNSNEVEVTSSYELFLSGINATSMTETDMWLHSSELKSNLEMVGSTCSIYFFQIACPELL